MPRIELPEGSDSESIRLMQLQPAMGQAMGVLADAIYNKSSLDVRVREAVRMRIAQLNQCQICLNFRFNGLEEHGIDEAFYANVDCFENSSLFSEAEKQAIEYAQRFAQDHTSIDDAFLTQLKTYFSDKEVYELSVTIAGLIANGRVLQVLQVDQMCSLSA